MKRSYRRTNARFRWFILQPLLRARETGEERSKAAPPTRHVASAGAHAFYLANFDVISIELFTKARVLFTTHIHCSPGRTALLCVALLIVCCAISSIVQAVSPPPDGGYPGGNTAEGQKALFSLTSGTETRPLVACASGANTGNLNTGVGAWTLALNTADYNTACGAAALLFNGTGSDNTAVGTGALLFNTIGEGNTATGTFALYSNTEGEFNTANGEFALYFNSTGERNTAIGNSAL